MLTAIVRHDHAIQKYRVTQHVASQLLMIWGIESTVDFGLSFDGSTVHDVDVKDGFLLIHCINNQLAGER
jgi:hypothetical protein